MLEKTPENHVCRLFLEFELQIQRYLAASVAQLLKHPTARHMSERPTDKLNAQPLIFLQLVARAKSLADAASMQLERCLNEILATNMNLGIVTPGKKRGIRLNILDERIHLRRRIRYECAAANFAHGGRQRLPGRYRTAFIRTRRMPIGAMNRAKRRQALNRLPAVPSSSDVEFRHIIQPAKIVISNPPSGSMMLLVR